MARPSPRTQGVTAEGETFQKFGTQQLVKDPTSPTGVRQVNTGQWFKDLTTAPFQTFKNITGLQTGTVFSQRILSGQTGATPVGAVYAPDPAQPNGETVGTGKCVEDNPLCGFEEVITGQPSGSICKCPNWFGWDEEKENGNGNGEECDLGCWITGRGCDCGCKDMKPCTTCDSDVCQECNAWDLQCEDCHTKNGTCTKPPEPKTTIFWVKIGLVIFAIGVFLWLLRPLFSRGGSKPTGGFTITPA